MDPALAFMPIIVLTQLALVVALVILYIRIRKDPLPEYFIWLTRLTGLLALLNFIEFLIAKGALSLILALLFSWITWRNYQQYGA